MTKIRILIVDDHSILRAGLRMLINAQTDMEVVDEAADGYEALEKVRNLNPDIVLLDISMPGISGIKAIEQIVQICPQTRILVLTMHDDPAYLRSVLAAGGSGYVVKKSADSELLSAIRTVYRGRPFVDPALGASLVSDLLNKKTSRKQTQSGALEKLLSKREREVLQLLAHGFTNQQIADKIFVSVKTVETYRSRLLEKLGLRNRADLIRYALEIGILSSDKFADDKEKIP
jgi:two-component system response regulator NreC